MPHHVYEHSPKEPCQLLLQNLENHCIAALPAGQYDGKFLLWKNAPPGHADANNKKSHVNKLHAYLSVHRGRGGHVSEMQGQDFIGNADRAKAEARRWLNV